MLETWICNSNLDMGFYHLKEDELSYSCSAALSGSAMDLCQVKGISNNQRDQLPSGNLT